MKRAVACLIIIASLVAAGRVIKYKRHAPNKTTDTENAGNLTAVYDTIVCPPKETLSISGYDKSLNATKEVFFVTNNSADTIYGISLTFTYLDMTGRQLHKRSHRLDDVFPAAETRRAQISSWDTNRSFYYKNSREPRTAAIPYDITLHIDTLFVSR